MKVEGYSLSLHQHPNVQRTLYPHQVVMADEWDKHSTFLLLTKTGSGKTAAAALPVLLHAKQRLHPPQGAVFVYPTNALIEDQERSIRKLIEAEGMKAHSLMPENAKKKYGDEHIVLVRVDAEHLEKFAKAYGFRKADGSPDKGRALAQVLKLDKPKIVLVNPDILYLVYTLAYRSSAEDVALLQAYQTVVFDEFHLYGGVELAHALFLIHLTRALHTFQRVVLLSATPDQQTKEWLDQLLQPYSVDSTTTTARPKVDERLVAHAVDLEPISRGMDVVTAAHDKILELCDVLRTLRAENLNEEYVPAVVILNSVVKAIELEDALVESGFARDEIAPIRGLTSRVVRDVRGKTLVIGTSAIEVGIDFKCDYLVFEAGDAASFMQRFGRVGRHQPGKAHLLESVRVSEAIVSSPTISRTELERQVYALYEVADARPWFVGTTMGMLSVYVQANLFRSRVAATRHADPDYVAAIDKWIDDVLDDYASKLQMERKLTQVRRMYERLKKGSKYEQWIKDYEAIDTFRTSLPSEKVFDWREAERRGKHLATYSVDVYTLIRQAHDFRFKEGKGSLPGKMIVYGGWEKPHYTCFNQSFTDHDCGIIKTTKDYPDLLLYRDGHLTSASYLLIKPKPHIFIVLPKHFRRFIDWRMAIFPCGEYVLAFDGDALLLKEIFDRENTQRVLPIR
jgi:CRISPR-associated helicase Cas3